MSEALAAHGVAVSPEALGAADPLARRDIDLGLGAAATDQRRGWGYFNLVLEHCGV